MVYIARMGATYSERDIIYILQHANIGVVAYADLTAVKDNSPIAGPNPATVWYSAFIMMKEWNPAALADMHQFGQVKVWLNSQSTAYWMLRFATEGSEIPRSRVNTHQLAHYTAELYDRSSTMTKKTEDCAALIEENNTRLSSCVKDLYDITNAAEKRAKEQAVQIAEQAVQIAEQAVQIAEQNGRMAHMLEQMEKLLVKNCELTQTVACMTPAPDTNASKHGCSYKDAMVKAKAEYNSTFMGELSVPLKKGGKYNSVEDLLKSNKLTKFIDSDSEESR